MKIEETWFLDHDARESLKSFGYEYLNGIERDLVLDIAHYCRFVDGVSEELWPTFLEYRVLKKENPGYTSGGSLYDSWQNTLRKRGLIN
jgi:hypothetical protein